MKITYIYHSSFSVESTNAVFLFDYFKGNIPLFPLQKHLFVFASHKHPDHFNFSIFKLAQTYPNITFVLSSDIKMNQSYLDRKGIPAKTQERIRFITKNSTLDLHENLISPLSITTLSSTDQGVAFLLEFEGKKIYHAGDLNWWSWHGETQEEANDMKNRFIAEIKKIEGLSFDAAFLPLDPRQEDLFYLGFHYFMKNTHTKNSFPMHFWEDYSIIQKLKNMNCAKDYVNSIIDISREGQVFQI